MRCTICQRFLPKTVRKGTRFCGTNCRSRAYRLRQQQEEISAPAPPGTVDFQRRPNATRVRKRANNPVTIPAVLEHLQQVRERAGLPPLQTDPMLAYQANLDALLTEHMATQRILATHVTDAVQASRGNTARLKDLSKTKVGIGIALTKRGDSVVVIILGSHVAQDRAPKTSEARISSSAKHQSPSEEIQQPIPEQHETPAARKSSHLLRTQITKLKR